MLIDVALIAAGVGLLWVASDRFVLGAARLSMLLRVSPAIVGAVVIGFGTSAPELSVTSLATLRGAQDIAYGNIVGSNITNLTLVLGAAAVVSPIAVGRTTVRRELPLAMLAMAVLVSVTVDRAVSLLDAVVLIAASVGVLGVLLLGARADRRRSEEAGHPHGGPGPPPAGWMGTSVARAGLVTAAGLVGVLVGAEFLVQGASNLAEDLGISEAVVGLTVVAIGTSLPELVTAVAAGRKGEPEIVVGNVLGSTIFNSLPVAGVAGVLDTVELAASLRVNLLVMVVAGLVATVVLVRAGTVRSWEGWALVAAFAAWLTGTGLAG